MRSRPAQDELPRGRLGVSVAVALVLAGVSVAAVPTVSSDRLPKIAAFRAKADAHVSVATRSANFGRGQRLTFAVRGDGEEMKRLNLLVYSHTRSQLGYQVRLATRRWNEREITFENAPRPSSRFVSSGPLRARAWKAVDVTSLVGSVDEQVSFVLTTVGMQAITLASRESGLHGPRLVVEYDDGRTSSSPPTEPFTSN
jgi:hypothetical protein